MKFVKNHTKNEARLQRYIGLKISNLTGQLIPDHYWQIKLLFPHSVHL